MSINTAKRTPLDKVLGVQVASWLQRDGKHAIDDWTMDIVDNGGQIDVALKFAITSALFHRVYHRIYQYEELKKEKHELFSQFKNVDDAKRVKLYEKIRHVEHLMDIHRKMAGRAVLAIGRVDRLFGGPGIMKHLKMQEDYDYA